MLVAGCGGDERATAPPLPAAVAESLAARSDAVAERLEAGNACAARTEAEALQAEAIAAVNDERIPGRYQEELVGSVNALVESISCAPAPPAAEDEEEDDEEEDDGKGRGKGKGNGNGKKDRDR
jgi:hypothetical protein